jgi:hypothetical protein
VNAPSFAGRHRQLSRNGAAGLDLAEFTYRVQRATMIAISGRKVRIELK